MRPAYDLYAFIVQGVPAHDAVHKTDEVLKLFGAEINVDCILSLGTGEPDTPDPDYIEDQEVALRILEEWPTLGSITYDLAGTMFIVTYRVKKEKGKVKCIDITVSANFFDENTQENQKICFDIAKSLHSIFSADRTIMQWRNAAEEIVWVDELERIKRGIFVGEYDIDLRK